MNYAQPDGSTPVEMYAEPERTSKAAILSLVLGFLGCCGGLTSIFAILLGLLGIFKVKGSNGRIGGMGLAIAGLLIGLLTLAIWIAIAFGINKAAGAVDTFAGQPTAQIFLDLQSDNFDGARAAMGSPAADATDEELIAFREAYRSAIGDYTARPSGIIEYFKGWISMGPQMQAYQGTQNMIPLPFYFENGDGLVLIFIDPNGQNTVVVQEIIIIDQNRIEYKLPADGG